jgi:septum formation protein
MGSVMQEHIEQQACSASSRVSELVGEKLLLASASPRRAEILRNVGWPFETLAVDIDETPHEGEEAEPYIKRLALTKAQTAARQRSRALVLGADTTVVVDGEMLGKPRDEGDARRMLRLLQGRWHEVMTGVALVRAGEEGRHLVAHETTRVRFGAMSVEEIDGYVRTHEPMDKAGAYAVQGVAALFIEQIEGDYWNVVGLPIRLVYKLAQEL